MGHKPKIGFLDQIQRLTKKTRGGYENTRRVLSRQYGKEHSEHTTHLRDTPVIASFRSSRASLQSSVAAA